MAGFQGFGNVDMVDLREVGGVSARVLSGAGLRGLRGALGFSQVSLGEFLRVSQAKVTVWERGKRECPDWLFTALDALRVSHCELVDGYAEMFESGQACELFDDQDVWRELYPRAGRLPTSFQNSAVMGAFSLANGGLALSDAGAFEDCFYIPTFDDAPQIIWL